MNLIDTNAVGYIFHQGIQIQDVYHMAPEVAEEVEMTELVHGKSTPEKIRKIDGTQFFKEGYYIDFFSSMLNKHSGKSFFNMTGFGDISILATIHTTIKVFDLEKSERLFDPTETIFVFTSDNGLIKRISREFEGADVEVRGLSQLV